MQNGPVSDTIRIRGGYRGIFMKEGVDESFSDLGEIRVWLRADFQSGSRVLKKVF